MAALKCRAERDGDDYIINGTKIWTTYAHKANKIFCLVRTRDESKPQAGITFLMFDLDLPGIEVRPILTFGGEVTIASGTTEVQKNVIAKRVLGL